MFKSNVFKIICLIVFGLVLTGTNNSKVRNGILGLSVTTKIKSDIPKSKLKSGSIFLLNDGLLKSDPEPLLLVANKHSNTLSYVDMKNFRVVRTIPTGPNPHEIIVTPDQRFAYFSSYIPPGNTISVVDLLRQKLIKEINTGEYVRIHGAAIAPEGEKAYFTAGQTGYVVEVDTKTNEVTRGIPTGGKLSHMVYVSPNGKFLYTGNISSADVSVIDRKTGKIITKIPTGKGAGGMTFSPDGEYLWVTNETDETISIIDLSSNKVIETISCPGVIKRIAFTPDEKLILVTSWTDIGEVIVLDALTKKEVKRIKVGNNAIGLAFTPDGKYAFVGCEDAHVSKVDSEGEESLTIKTEDSNGVHVIDMNSLEVIKTINTGLGPDPMAVWYPPETVVY